MFLLFAKYSPTNRQPQRLTKVAPIYGSLLSGIPRPSLHSLTSTTICWRRWFRCSVIISTFWEQSQICSCRILFRMRRLSCRFRFSLVFLRAFLVQLTNHWPFQRCAVPLFEAYRPPLTQEITANIKGLINSIALAIELAPAATWGEPLHISGLFGVLVNHLADDKVYHKPFVPRGGKSRLTGLLSYRRSSS